MISSGFKPEGRQYIAKQYTGWPVGVVRSWRTAKFTLVHIYVLPGEEGRVHGIPVNFVL